GDYLEPNGAIPDQIHGSAKDTLEWMTGRLRMNLARGDALYEIGKLK
ncbi:hypothetical protein HYW43_05090, partial [Candidatus Daviesbacteria bacterium]|nr:hypothetical protein [Candidatus Daviesbacteria bacterium]